MNRSRRAGPIVAGLAAWLAAVPGAAWHEAGHEAIARHAVACLPDDVPAFFRAAGDDIARGAADADLFKHPALPALTRAEAPEHYFNLERLGGEAFPADRYELTAWLHERGLAADELGWLPYAIVEWSERLTLAFAEYRRWPQNRHARARARVYAGVLAHYSGDLSMPLHTTVHHDGRRDPDGSSPRTGIHARLDGLLDKLPVDEPAWSADIEPAVYEGELLAAVAEALRRSHARVERVYELDAQIPPLEAERVQSAAVRELGRATFRHGVEVTASLFVTAWRRSGEMSLPGWRSAPVEAQNEQAPARSN